MASMAAAFCRDRLSEPPLVSTPLEPQPLLLLLPLPLLPPLLLSRRWVLRLDIPKKLSMAALRATVRV